MFPDHDKLNSNGYPMSIDDEYNGSRKRVRASSVTGMNRHSSIPSWKQDHQLPQSSPIEPSYPTLHDSPMFDAPAISAEDSDDEDFGRPAQSMQEPSSSVISSSPPRTPPPRRMPNASKQASADLLMYLTNSPRSPTVRVAHLSSAQKDVPTTPPSRHTHLNTPGANLGLFNGALHTPGQNFNFADFCNVTPSPGQAQWGGRTPAMSKTPARLARRGLNFDSIVPPTSNDQRNSSSSQGLALQLGEELVPRS